jgi:uncharacterized membrane protein (DUF4010 family)
MNEPLLYRLAVAFGIGLIVGLERGWKTREEHGGTRAAGIRSFALAGLLGGVTAALAYPDHVIVMAAGLLVVGALVVASYLLNVRVTNDHGLTTEVALITTFALGGVAVLGAPFEATAGAVVMAVVLSFKLEIHRLVRGLERRELNATLQLLLIAVVLVPLLPDRDLGPWEAINPRTIGILVFLIAGLSYLGYFAVRVFGTRLGLLLTAVCGGLSSSTAITVAYARRAQSSPGYALLLGTGIALSAATMVPRLAVEIAAVNAAVLLPLWPTLTVLVLVPLAQCTYVIFRRGSGEAQAEVTLSNPLQLKAAVVFGLLLSVLFIAAAALHDQLGHAGVYATAAVAGLVDVDAIGLTLARAAGRGMDAAVAVRGIAVAVLVNTGTKAVLAAALGGRGMLRSASLVLALALVAAAITAALTL